MSRWGKVRSAVQSSTPKRFGTLTAAAILETRQNVQVHTRFRPFMGKNESEADGLCVDIVPDAKLISLKRATELKENKKFIFDNVFPPETQQDRVYEMCAKPLVEEVFAGYNCTIFAYGQTGSGKTHTMMGDLSSDHSMGIIPRLIQDVFLGIQDADEFTEFTLKVSFLEIYMERVRDLLDPRKENLPIRETRSGELYVQGATETYVGSQDQVMDVLNKGQRNRAIGQTQMNIQSSRSHSVMILTLSQRDTNSGSKRKAKMILVDLAGSEKVRKSEAKGQTLKEAQHINKSLSALGNVINHLTEGKPHVPYRDSKLTRLLTDSLGGNSKTSLIITCSPALFNEEETLSTLRFGSRAKMIRNKPHVNQERSIEEYKAMVENAKKQIERQAVLIQSLEGDVRKYRAIIKRLDPNFDPNNAARLREMGIEAQDLDKAVMSGALMGSSVEQQPRGNAKRSAQGNGEESDRTAVDSSGIVADLQRRMEDLELELAESQEQYSALKDQLVEKESELDVHVQMYEDRDQEVSEMKVDLELHRDKIEELEQQVAEYAVFRKKVEVMEQEYIIQLDELEVENADLTEKLHALLLNEIESRYIQAQRARARKDQRPHRLSGAADKPPSSPAVETKSSANNRAVYNRDKEKPLPTGVELPAPNSVRAELEKTKGLEKENRRLQAELKKKGQQYLTLSGAFDQLKQSVDVDKVDVTMKLSQMVQENTDLQYEMQKLQRQVETQDRLLKNRQAHVDVLELALEEANILHKKADMEKKQQMEALKKKLDLAQQMFEDVFRDQGPGHGRKKSGSNIIVPMHGGGHQSRPSYNKDSLQKALNQYDSENPVLAVMK